MQDYIDNFDHIWFLDFEFSQIPGEVPDPVCLVAKELRSGRCMRYFKAELHNSKSPFATDARTIFVAYYSAAEWGCFLSLGWPLPERVLDLYVEFRNLTCNLPVPAGYDLLGALTYFGLDALAVAGAQSMRELARRGAPYTADENCRLLDFCQGNVDGMILLMQKMAEYIDLPRALLRGRYMTAVAHMERNGIPLDANLLDRLNNNWSDIRENLISGLDEYGLWEGFTFKYDRFALFLKHNGIAWPCTDSGQLKLDRDTFRSMSRLHPTLETVHQLRYALSELRLNDLSVGRDGRNRVKLSPFASKTGRNQPSTTKFIFGPAVWIRGLITPPCDQFVAYIDYCQQEFAIAGALSGDAAMQAAYQSGDPYLTFAKQAGAVPADATRESHQREREQFKICALAVQYGMGEQSLALMLNEPVHMARRLLELHRCTYSRYWQCINETVNTALLGIPLKTVFGWTLHAGEEPNPRSLANFPAQANGAEMLRLACCLAVERGIKVCAPIHDALLIEGPIEDMQEIIRQTKECMAEAGRIVLDGFEMRTDEAIVKHPGHYMDKRGIHMWDAVMALLSKVETQNHDMDVKRKGAPVTAHNGYLLHGVTPGPSY